MSKTIRGRETVESNPVAVLFIKEEGERTFRVGGGVLPLHACPK